MSTVTWICIAYGVVVLLVGFFAWALCRAAAMGDRVEYEASERTVGPQSMERLP